MLTVELNRGSPVQSQPASRRSSTHSLMPPPRMSRTPFLPSPSKSSPPPQRNRKWDLDPIDVISITSSLIRHHQHLYGADHAKRPRNRGDSSWLTSSYLPSHPAHINQITCQWGNGLAHMIVDLNSCMSYRMCLGATGSVPATPMCQLRDRGGRAG
ncbi:hypothetical protein EI94DRAFT_1738044, partial [Lactarius quietus]